jgi:hypothetical protein
MQDPAFLAALEHRDMVTERRGNAGHAASLRETVERAGADTSRMTC